MGHPSSTVVNALTIDVEDWHQLVEWKLNGKMPPCSPHVLVQTYDLLDVLAAHGVRATFFVLGVVAESHPRLVKDIAAAGHEIASHGWSHQLVFRQTRDEFARETRLAKSTLEDIVGQPIAGYRAAEFSITTASRWALEVLAESGFRYDSSIFPIQSRRYGIPGTPLRPHVISTPAGAITEVPLTAIERWNRRWPAGGGGYFRLLPYSVTRAAVRQVNAEGRAANMYFHPYEFSTALLVPRLTSLRRYVTGARYVLFHNANRQTNRNRFRKMLDDFHFTAIADLINHNG